MRPLTLVNQDDIHAAAANIAGVAVRTPLLAPLAWPGLWLKPESLQPIGAFKVRGAVHAVANLPPDVRARGVVTHSSGNHGQALACAVVMPDVAPKIKVDAVRALGAEVILVSAAERNARTEEIAASRGMVLI